MQNHFLDLVQSLFVLPNSQLALFLRATIASRLISTGECFLHPNQTTMMIRHLLVNLPLLKLNYMFGLNGAQN